MEVQYIIAIVGGGLVVLMLLIYVVVSIRRSNREERKRRNIERMYADKNLAKMDYDFIALDEEASKILSSRRQGEGQLTIDDVLAGLGSPNDRNDNDGPEEITGNYKPE